MLLAGICLPVLLISQISAIPFFNPDLHTGADPVTLKLVHSSHARFQRSVDERFPDFMHFNVDGLNTTLRLRRALRQTADIRLLDLIEGCLKETKEKPSPETVLYEDPDASGDFMVRRSTNGELQLAGTFLHENTLKKISPAPTANRVKRHTDDHLHIVSIVEFPINFGNDAITKAQAEAISQQFPQFNQMYPKIVPEYLSTSDRIREVNTAELGTDHIVEIFVLTDYADFLSFMGETSNNARQAKSDMLVYYTFIEQTMNRYYQSVNVVDNSFNIQIRFVSIYVPDARSKAPYSEDVVRNGGVELSQIIESYRNYFKNTQGVPQVDHWLGFTGYDMVNQGSSSVIGVAYIGGLCSKDLQLSVSENRITGLSGLIVAHELGHNINSEHDAATCNSNHIMAPSVVYPTSQSDTNPFYFSSCSVQAFKSYLNSASGSCTRTIEDASYIPYSEKYLGQVYNADTQCDYSRERGSTFCRTGYSGAFDEMCWGFKCQAPGSTSCFNVRVMDFTSCGNRKWCVQGRCVASSQAAQTQENCPQGDDPTANCIRASCNSYTSDKRTYSCCATCGQPLIVSASPTASPTTVRATSATTSPRTSPTVSQTPQQIVSENIPANPTSPIAISAITSPITSPSTSRSTSPTTQQATSPITSPNTSPARDVNIAIPGIVRYVKLLCD